MLRSELDQGGGAKAFWRVSSGSAAVLGLTELRMDTAPTTVYIMLGERCLRNCAYCAQAHTSTASSAALSRVSWPPFPAEEIAQTTAQAFAHGTIKRACLQVTLSRDAFQRTLEAVRLLKSRSTVPVCCSLTIDKDEQIAALFAAGADKVTLALDAACESVYRQVRGSDWAQRLAQLERVALRFPGCISSHLIAGLGETECQFISRLQALHDLGIGVGLFAFTPIPGTLLASRQPPDLESYRRMQAARFLIYELGLDSSSFSFNSDGRLTDYGVSNSKLGTWLGDGTAFRTSGCPDCNRPYYNERPGGVMYNYPRPFNKQECAR